MPGEERYAEDGRAPLDAAALRRALLGGPVWRRLDVLDAVTSTNDVAAAAARAGDPGGLVVVAEEQTSGRGRIDREWVSPRGAGLTCSVVVRPDVPPERVTWLPLLAGVAAVRAIASVAGLTAGLKWPNDVLVGGRKAGGLLAEAVGGAVVIGIGLNVSTTRAELPREDATSLQLERGTPVDRGPLLLGLLRCLGDAYVEWAAGGGDPAASLTAYRRHCDTLGRDVRVELPRGPALVGRAVDVDETGRLLVRAVDGVVAVSAGDVTHVRPVA